MAQSRTDITTITAEQIDYLRSIDSPTIANAVEPFQVRDRCDGFIGGTVGCLFPDLGTMVGYALTVTMTNQHGEVAGREGYWRMWETLEQMPRPSVLVVQDVSDAPSRVAFCGEVMATMARKLGAVGIVSDGGVRDIAEVHALGMHYFAPFPVVAHANFSIVDVGIPITLDGQEVRTGDILHGDANGIVIVPPQIVADLPAAVDKIRQTERATMDYVTSDAFSVAEARQRSGY